MAAKLVKIHNHNAIIRGIIQADFHIANNNTNILHAKLQGANHAKNAINIVFDFFLHLCLFCIDLYIKNILNNNKITHVTTWT